MGLEEARDGVPKHSPMAAKEAVASQEETAGEIAGKTQIVQHTVLVEEIPGTNSVLGKVEAWLLRAPHATALLGHF